MRGSLVVVALLSVACRSERSEPSEPTPAEPPSATPSAAAAAPSASAAPKPRARAPRSAADGAAQPVGGNWLKCYANFRPRTDPKLEVLRLGLMCGPSNGMRKAHEATGQAGAGTEHRFSAEAGDCYRVFAVGEPSVEDLDVEVLDPSGKRVAWDTSDDRWPIVEPDGPFCALVAGEYRTIVRAQRGAGRYAVEVWRLR